MQDLQPFGKIMIVAGLLMAGMGLVLLFAGKIPGLGKLPGDIVVEKKNFTFYFPLATSLVVSGVLSFLLWVLRRK